MSGPQGSGSDGMPPGTTPAGTPAPPGSRRAMRAAAGQAGSSEAPAPAASDAVAPAPAPAPPAGPPLTRLPYGVEPPTSDVSPVAGDARLPGAHRGGFARLPTQPIGIMSQSSPSEPGTEPIPAWEPPRPQTPPRGFAVGALTFAILGLIGSFFIGWAFPLGVVAIVLAIVALRRPLENRSVAIWAIALAAVSLVYSAGWLLYAASFI